MPRRRVHTVAGKRQAVLKALGDMYNLEPPLPQAPVCQAWAGPDQGRVRWASPGGRSRSCGISAPAGRCRGGPTVSSRGPPGRVIMVAPWWAPCWVESEYGCRGAKWVGPLFVSSGQTPVGPLSGTPAHLDTGRPKGRAAPGHVAPGVPPELCVGTHVVRAPGTARRFLAPGAAPPRLLPQAPPGAEAGLPLSPPSPLCQ